MEINKYFEEIEKYAHYQNWLEDWRLVKEIYNKFPDSYSILTPFAYSYLEELIRSTTSEYGRNFIDKYGKRIKRKTGIKLIEFAIEQNRKNEEYVFILENVVKEYFNFSIQDDYGNNRNSVDHGFLPPLYWKKVSFEKLILDISRISKFAKF